MSVETISKSAKKGGPYTKKQQEKRRNEVYGLHFERGCPAQKIAEILKVNRNTINSDINFWYSQLATDWEDNDVKKWIIKQLERFELQRSRLYDELKNCNIFADRLLVEKIILDIDQKISQIITKLLLNYKYNFSISAEKEDKQEKIEKFVKLLLKSKHSSKSCYTEDALIEEAVRLTRCDVLEAELMFEKMSDLGLCYCGNDDEQTKYDVLEFSKLRGYSIS